MNFHEGKKQPNSKPQPPPAGQPKPSPAPRPTTNSNAPKQSTEARLARLQKQLQALRKDRMKEQGINEQELRQKNIEFYKRDLEEREKFEEGSFIISDENRTCTNFACCVLFVAFIGFMFVVAVVGFSRPGWGKLTSIYDAEGFACGVKNATNGDKYVDYPYAYFASPRTENLWRTVCVKKCPGEGDTSLQCLPNQYVPSCSATPPSTRPQDQVLVYGSTTVWGRFCLPTSSNLKGDIMTTAGQSNIVSRVLSIRKTWPIVLAAIPFSIVLSILIMLLVKLTKKWTIYVLLGISIASCLSLGVYLLFMPAHSRIANNLSRLIGKAFSIFMIMFGVVVLGGFIKNRSRIKLAYIIIKSSTKFISQNRIIALLPFLLLLVALGYLVLLLAQTLSFYSLSTEYRHNRQLPFQHFYLSWKVLALMALQVVHFLWVFFFLMDTNDFIVSGTAVNWYYDPRKTEDADIPADEDSVISNVTVLPEQLYGENFRDLKKEAEQQYNKEKAGRKKQSRASSAPQSERRSNFYSSVYRYMRYHMGSVAFGSFLQTVFGVVKFLYRILTPEQTTKFQLNVTNDFKKVVDMLCCCCVSYVFNCINSGTYGYIHLRGLSYCAASLEVLELKVREGTCEVIVGFIGLLFSIIVRTGVTVLTVLIGYIIISTTEPFKSYINDATLFNIVIGTIAFLISSLFGSFYSDSMEAIFVCYLQDKNWQDEGQKIYSPERFKKFIIKADRQVEKQGNQEDEVQERAKRMKKLEELDQIKDVLHSADPRVLFQRLRDAVLLDEDEKKKKKEEEQKEKKGKASAPASGRSLPRK